MPNTMESAVAKVAGTAGLVEARFRGLRGVFTKLAEQHHEVGSLLARAESATDPSKRKELWSEIRKELISHEQAELIEIYPLLESQEATRPLAREHLDHAGVLEVSIREVDRLGPQSDEWEPAIARVIVALREHVKLEETKLFPAIQEALGEETAKQLEEPFLRTQELSRNGLR